MKGINFANIGLGMELSPSFNKQNQEGLIERLTAMLTGLTNNAQGVVILQGCVMTVVGSQYNQTAGVVYYQGEILSVDAFAGNSASQVPVYQAATTTYTGQAWYGDAAKRDTFYVRKLPMAMGARGSGVSDYDAVVRLENIKANKAQSGWNDITLINGSLSRVTPQFRIDQFGQIHLRGSIWWNSNNPQNSYIAQGLPPAPPFKDSLELTITCGSSTGIFAENCLIDNSGKIQLRNPLNRYLNVYLDGVSYWVDY